MKKILLVLVFFVSFTLISCTENESDKVLEYFAENNNSPYQLTVAL